MKDDKEQESIVPEIKDQVIEITVLEDQINEKNVVYMRKLQGEFVVLEMANLLADKEIADLASE